MNYNKLYGGLAYYLSSTGVTFPPCPDVTMTPRNPFLALVLSSSGVTHPLFPYMMMTPNWGYTFLMRIFAMVILTQGKLGYRLGALRRNRSLREPVPSEPLLAATRETKRKRGDEAISFNCINQS
jgi:hypothetical protein